MADIVGAFGVPHNPHFPTWVANGHPLAEEIERMYGALRRHYERAAPDTLIVFTSDHYNLFWETLPIFAIGAAEAARGASDYPELVRELRIDAALSRHVQARVVEAGFDVGMLQELALDHTIVAPLHFLAPEDVAIVPVYINAFIRPLPSARRCFALGRAIRDAVRSAPGSARVAIVASGSFSLEVGGPRISETSHTRVPDPAWVERVVELLRAGAVERLVVEASDEQLWRAGNAGGEILDWIAMLATIDPRPPTFIDVQAQFGHAYAAWPL